VRKSILIYAVLSASLVVRADALDDQLFQEMNTINRQAPIMMDQATRLDNAAYVLHTRTFVYNYTVLSHASSHFSPDQKKKHAQLSKEYSAGRACTASATRALLDAGITLKYVHFGNDGRLISESLVTKGDCSGQKSSPMTPAHTEKRAKTYQTADENRTKGGRGAAMLPPSPEGETVSAIKIGDSYASVMEQLKTFSPQKNEWGLFVGRVQGPVFAYVSRCRRGLRTYLSEGAAKWVLRVQSCAV